MCVCIANCVHIPVRDSLCNGVDNYVLKGLFTNFLKFGFFFLHTTVSEEIEHDRVIL